MSPATSRSARMTRRASPISASGTARSMAAAATPISIRRPDTNSPLCVGFTYNFENPHTDYKNGVDMHLDLGRLAVPEQAIADRPRRLRLSAAHRATAAPATGVGCFKSRVFGVGPQIGYIFPLGDAPGLPESQGLQGIRRRAPAGRLERLAHIRDLAGRGPAAAGEAGYQEVGQAVRQAGTDSVTVIGCVRSLSLRRPSHQRWIGFRPIHEARKRSGQSIRGAFTRSRYARSRPRKTLANGRWVPSKTVSHVPSFRQLWT